LTDPNAAVKEAMVVAVAGMFADGEPERAESRAKALKQLLDGGAIKALLMIIADKQGPTLHAIGCLRNISVVGGLDMCEYIVDQDAMTPLLLALHKAVPHIAETTKQHILNQTLALLGSLSSASVNAVNRFMSCKGSLECAMACLTPLETHVPDMVVSAASLLHVMSDSNEQFARQLYGCAGAVPALLGMVAGTAGELTAVARFHVGGALLNALPYCPAAGLAAAAGAEQVLPVVLQAVLAGLSGALPEVQRLLPLLGEEARVACASAAAESATAAAAAATAKPEKPEDEEEDMPDMADGEERVEDAGQRFVIPEASAAVKAWDLAQGALVLGLEMLTNECANSELLDGEEDEEWETDEEEEVAAGGGSGAAAAAIAAAGGAAAGGGGGGGAGPPGQSPALQRTVKAVASAGLFAQVATTLKALGPLSTAAMRAAPGGEGPVVGQAAEELVLLQQRACACLGNMVQNLPLQALGNLRDLFGGVCGLLVARVSADAAQPPEPQAVADAEVNVTAAVLALLGSIARRARQADPTGAAAAGEFQALEAGHVPFLLQLCAEQNCANVEARLQAVQLVAALSVVLETPEQNAAFGAALVSTLQVCVGAAAQGLVCCQCVRLPCCPVVGARLSGCRCVLCVVAWCVMLCYAVRHLNATRATAPTHSTNPFHPSVHPSTHPSATPRIPPCG
jgi:hypothetical protein